MATYTYNPDGLRRSKHVLLTLEQRYIWSGDSMVYECELLFPANGTVYVYGINLISARNSDGDDTFYLYNAHGDVVQLVDGTGTITQTYNYDAFGVEYDVDEDDNNPLRYCGEYFDKETGTYYLRARYYNPAIGRFTQQDGWEFGDINDPLSLNLYSYCSCNPVMYYDITGNNKMTASYMVSDSGGGAGNVIKYDVPMYKQGSLSLCWAFCQVMMESFNSGIKLTQKEAKARAIEIAKAYHDSTKKKDWNEGGWPDNLGEPIGDIGSIDALYNTLKDNGPVYAYYYDEKSGDAHIVIVTGVDLNSGVVYTNNPWGVKGEQSYEKFQEGFATKWYHFSSGKSTSGAIIYLMD